MVPLTTDYESCEIDDSSPARTYSRSRRSSSTSFAISSRWCGSVMAAPPWVTVVAPSLGGRPAVVQLGFRGSDRSVPTGQTNLVQACKPDQTGLSRPVRPTLYKACATCGSTGLCLDGALQHRTTFLLDLAPDERRERRLGDPHGALHRQLDLARDLGLRLASRREVEADQSVGLRVAGIQAQLAWPVETVDRRHVMADAPVVLLEHGSLTDVAVGLLDDVRRVRVPLRLV